VPLNPSPTDEQPSGEAESSDSGIPAEHHVSCRSIESSTAYGQGRDVESGFGRATHSGGHLRGRVKDISGPPSACSAAWSLVMAEGVTVAISQSTSLDCLAYRAFCAANMWPHAYAEANVVSLSGRWSCAGRASVGVGLMD